MSKAIITCALNGVLTDPRQHNVPRHPPPKWPPRHGAPMTRAASVMHIHLRQQGTDKGHLPAWDIDLSRAVQSAIRDACPDVIINHTTGTVGPRLPARARLHRGHAARNGRLQRGLAELSQAAL